MQKYGVNQIEYGQQSNGTIKKLVKRAIKVFVKRITGASDETSESEENTESTDSDLTDLLELLEYLTLRKRLKSLNQVQNTFNNQTDKNLSLLNWTNQTHSHHQKHVEFELPVALVQLSIIVLVFLIVLFMCKCNQMMEWCRDCHLKQNSAQKRIQLEEDRYYK